MQYTHALSPIAFTLWGWPVHWYGLVYGIGFLVVLHWGWALYQRHSDSPNLSRSKWESLLFGGFIAGLIGGRLGHFLFYDPSIFWSDPIEVIRFWDGGIQGMSIHGGFLGSFFWGICFLYKNFDQKKILYAFSLSDAIVTPLCFILSLGRVTNYLNAELVGRPTDQTWGVVFPLYDNLLRHPSQLYEATAHGLVFLSLLFVLKSKPQTGTLTLCFILGYAVSRFVVEFFKDFPLYFYLTTGQWLCILMLMGGFGLAFLLPRNKAHPC